MTMKLKRTCSILLAAVLMLSLALPVFATKPKEVSLRSSLTMTVGEDFQLKATIRPLSADEQTGLTWKSSNEEVATVDQSGRVTAHSRGKAYISAKTENGKSASCLVTVRKVGENVAVKTIEMSMSSITVRVDQTRTLWVDITPGDASDDDVTWSSSNPDVASVDQEGVVTGISPGKATVTAEADGKTATCEVTVPEYLSGLTNDVKPESAQTNSGVYLSSTEVRTAVREAIKATKKGATGYARFNNKPTATTSAISAAAYEAEAAGRDIRLRFATTDSAGNTLGMITFDPQKAKARTEDFETGVYPASKNAQAVQKQFEKFYGNRLAVIELSQGGEFGFTAKVAAKASALSGVKASGLYFYSYDSAANKYTRLSIRDAAFDKNGYLHFSASSGGCIIVSEGALSKA